MLKKCLAISILTASVALAAEDPNDTYYYATECPEKGQSYADNSTADSNEFIRCQCVSYVANKLSMLFTARYWNNHGQANITQRFHNREYYMPQKKATRWSNAVYWKDIAINAGIGVTGGKDNNFTWDTASYNAVFYGDVAWWDAWVVKKPDGSVDTDKSNFFGHVAFVESATPDVAGKGVACVTVSEYNFSKYNFSRRQICKGDGKRFPDAFLHIDQDHAYCINHPDIINCSMLFGGQYIAYSGGKGYGIGGGSDTFNLKINNFWIVDGSGATITGDLRGLRYGETVQIKSQVKAVNGNTENHMRTGKTRIEVDLYAQEGLSDWRFLKREYIQAVNLPSGGTHTETAFYTVPIGVSQDISFRVKIDAEDEAYESNEGDNWSSVETFSPDISAWMTPITNYLLEQ